MAAGVLVALVGLTIGTDPGDGGRPGDDVAVAEASPGFPATSTPPTAVVPTTLPPTTAVPPTTPAPVEPSGDDQVVSYANCGQARAAGAAPLRIGDPG